MKMATSSILSFFFIILFSSFLLGASSHNRRTFIRCLIQYSRNDESITKIIYTPTNSSYTPILQLTLQNLRFATPETRKPLVIVTPVEESQIQAVIYCSRRKGMRLRIRSGGHDFEGQSYRATKPFVLLDMINLRSVSIDIESETAWVQAGVTLGELYYRIAEKSGTLGFPAGLWYNVGVSGLIGGGGYGMMKRKYGLAADNTLDARLIDVNGRILDRKSMGEDLFWAIRGGGVSSFAVVISWKIKLVRVPKIVTIFGVIRTLEQNGSRLFQKWQTIAPNDFPRDLDVRCTVDTIVSNSSAREDRKTVRFIFQSLFLGRIDNLLPIVQKTFPELGLVREDCLEVSWIQSTLYFSNFSIATSHDILLKRSATRKAAFKGKSSFVREPLSDESLNGVWEMLLKEPIQATLLQYTPFGGIMNEFLESALPFPHRPGVLYMLNIAAILDIDALKQIQWINDIFSYYAPYVTKNPRTSYVNYLDLDLGQGTTYKNASIWGRKYFNNNFNKLVKIKSLVDPENFFRHQQSIPVLYND